MNTVICIPTLNIGAGVDALVRSLQQQEIESEVLVIDSSSTDGAVELFEGMGARVHTIPRTSFDHGATRQLALSLFPGADIIIYLTQDAILASAASIKNILACFDDDAVGAACGRQLPHKDASAIAAHARLFNYPDESLVNSNDDISARGIKTAFISNSFAAYRRTALMEVGGFPTGAILSEDTYVAAKMLQAGWKLAYCAEATCYHSHNYSIKQEFQRYFDIGVFHGRERWYLDLLGRAEGEGKKFVVSELRHLQKSGLFLIPSAIARTGCKLLA